jgi:hypothetical protein
MADETIRVTLQRRLSETAREIARLIKELDDIQKAMVALEMSPEDNPNMPEVRARARLIASAKFKAAHPDTSNTVTGTLVGPAAGQAEIQRSLDHIQREFQKEAVKIDRRFGPKRPPPRERINEPIEELPIYVLILKILVEDYPNGATMQQLISKFIEKYHREITSNTFAVSLNQLKKSGDVSTEHRLWYATDKESGGNDLGK